jgi:hypothetical protein
VENSKKLSKREWWLSTLSEYKHSDPSTQDVNDKLGKKKAVNI